MTAGYGWIIDVDHLAYPTAPPASPLNAPGLIGPHDVDPAIEARLQAGEGERFRLLTDDDELCYEGRYIGSRSLDIDDDLGPLDDFGAPNAGATTIEYLDGGKWVAL